MASKDHFETLDTNVLLSLILEGQPHQREKTVRMLADSNRSFLIPDLVFAEAIRVITKQADIPRTKAAEAIFRALSAFYNLSYDLHIVTDVFHDYITHPALSFEDCYLAYCAAKNHAEPLWTFDKKFAKESPTAKEIL